MKRLLSLLSLLLLLAGCSSKPAPAWIDVGHKQLETFKQDFLTGRAPSITESHFRRSIEEIKKSGDIDLLGRAWLTRMALQVAVLAQPDAGEYPKLDAAQKVPGNRAFYLFLTGAEADGADLPKPYRRFWMELPGGDGPKVAAAISGIDDPLSRLIASGVALRKGVVTEAMLTNSVADASQNGWKRALIAWLERLQFFYEAASQADKAAAIAARVDLIRQ